VPRGVRLDGFVLSLGMARSLGIDHHQIERCRQPCQVAIAVRQVRREDDRIARVKELGRFYNQG